MSTHSVADARNHLSDLIDRALAGEAVVVSRHGLPVVELKPVRPRIGPVSGADLAWLATRRIGTRSTAGNAGTLLCGMRDEEER